jgi:hypothetical protein
MERLRLPFPRTVWAMSPTRFLAVVMVTALPLGGCGMSAQLASTVAVAGVVGSVAVFGRSPPDLVVSLISGKDCSVVRLDEGKSYCRQTEPPPKTPEFCTRSLGAVNCWADPAVLPDRPTQVADGPSTLSAAQEEDRTARWPW